MPFIGKRAVVAGRAEVVGVALEESWSGAPREPADMAVGPASGTRAVERALELLAGVCSAGPTTLSECARAAGLPTSTALRLLRTLEATGFVTRRGDASYVPGPRLLQLGAQAVGRDTLVRLAEPALRRVVAATGESAYLSVRGPGETAVYAAVCEGTHPVRHTSWAGRAVPSLGLPVGAALSGDVPPVGYVAGRDAAEPDVTAVVAPVRRPGGVAGALSVLGPTYRIGEATMHAYGRILAAEAAGLADQLGAHAATGQEAT